MLGGTLQKDGTSCLEPPPVRRQRPGPLCLSKLRVPERRARVSGLDRTFRPTAKPPSDQTPSAAHTRPLWLADESLHYHQWRLHPFLLFAWAELGPER